MEIKTGDFTVKFDDSDEVKQKVFDRLLEYYTEYKCFDGESLQQCDDPQIYAIDVLSDIADDIIKFETEWEV